MDVILYYFNRIFYVIFACANWHSPEGQYQAELKKASRTSRGVKAFPVGRII